MANTDSFIDEVTEEVRRERMFRLVRRYGWIGVVAVLAVVGGSAWNEWSKAQRRAQAEAFGDAVLTALAQPDAAARQAGLAGVTASGDAAAMLRLLAAGEAVEGGDTAARDAALADLAALASDATVSEVWRDLAALRRLSLPGAGVDPAERSAGLQALATPGRAFRPLALEQIALDRLAAGDTAGALADFRALSQDVQAPSALRRRAGQMIVVLGGEAPAPVAEQQ